MSGYNYYYQKSTMTIDRIKTLPKCVPLYQYQKNYWPDIGQAPSY